MINVKTMFLLALAVVAASCAPVDPPAPNVIPEGDDAYLIDPRTGWEGTLPPQAATRFETAWRWTMAGNEQEARTRLADVLTRHPDYTPARLAGAALDIRAGRYDDALAVVREALERDPDYLAARVYEAEIAVRRNDTRAAYDLYRAVAADPNAPAFAAGRVAQLQEALFNQTFAAAQTAGDAEAVRLLREALTLNPGAVEPRIQLAQRLVAQKEYDEARRELEPVLDAAPDRAEVQEMLAEIDFGRGRYQEAIVR